MNKIYYVYIVHCSDGSFHTAVTENLEPSVREHNTGADTESYTFSRRQVRLLYHALFHDNKKAEEFRDHLVSWTPDRLQALATGRWNEPAILSACIKASGHKFYGTK